MGPDGERTATGTATGLPGHDLPVADASAPLAQADPPHKTFGDRYEVTREIGKGGFGVVYQVFDRELAQHCCIKALLPQHAHGFSLVRFKREFRAARRVDHAACVRVYELAEREGVWFFSMELVAGGSLRQAAPLHGDVDAVVAVALSTLAALDHLHGLAIVHRDIKPSNILIERAATDATPLLRAKITDLGIAKVGDLVDDERLLGVIGSPPYLAPEMVLDGSADPRSDLYSLGVTLYEALAKRHPLGPGRGVTAAEWLHRIRRNHPIPLDRAAPHVPGALASFVMRLLARDPFQRYRSADHAHGELQAWWETGQRSWAAPRLGPLTARPYLAAPRLVGRLRERDQAELFVRRNLSAQPGPDCAGLESLLLLSGPSGVGKSRLLAWVSSLAERQGANVFTGQCRSEIGAPLEGVRRIVAALRSLTGQGPTAESHTHSHTRTEDQPGNMTKSISSRRPDVADGKSSDSALAASLAVDSAAGTPDAHGLRRLLHDLAELMIAAVDNRPTLIVVEDLQWGDYETVELIKLWARSIAIYRSEGRSVPVALAVSHRPAVSGSDVAELHRVLVDEHRALPIELAPFNPSDCQALAGELLMLSADDPQLAAACKQLFAAKPVTPLYIAEVLRLLLARGYLAAPDGGAWRGAWDFSRLSAGAHVLVPETLDDAIGQHTARLSGQTKALLAIAATIGRRFPLPVLARASELDDSLLWESLDEAARSGCVAEESGTGGREEFRFTHDRFREQIYAALGDPGRRALHGKVARALLALSLRRGRDIAADLALHYQAAGEYEPSYRFAAIAGARALRAAQFSRASDFFAAAVASADQLGRPVRRSVLESYGDAARFADHFDRAESAYRRVLARPRNLIHAVQVEHKLGELYARSQGVDRALAQFGKAMRRGKPWFVRGGVFTVLWYLLVVGPAQVLPPWWPRLAVRLVLSRIDLRRCQALLECALAASITAYGHGRPAAGFRFGFWATTFGLALQRRPSSAGFAVANCSLQFFEASMGRDARSLAYAQLAARSSASEWPKRRRWEYDLVSGASFLVLADAAAATSHLERAFELAISLRDPRLIEMSGRFLVVARLLVGHYEQGLAATARMLHSAQAEGLAEFERVALAMRTGLLAEGGDVRRSLADYEALRPHFAALQQSDRLVWSFVEIAHVRARLQVEGSSREVAELALAVLRQCQATRTSVPVTSPVALAFAAAVAACSQVHDVPQQARRRLAWLRYRPLPIEGRRRLTRPLWLGARALYDLSQGESSAARVRLNAALADCERRGLQYYYDLLCQLHAVVGRH
jgi:serine/threonine protein kinase/tetratricopeptide (TPR) repeat protein